MFRNLIRWVKVQNPKFHFLEATFAQAPFRLLDIGSGNNSATKTMALFPQCEYYGLDLDRNYNNNPADFQAMKGFYEMDLTLLNYQCLPDEFFDAILMVHVIEHLHNGEEVLKALLPKLKPGGSFYIEYPGEKSTRLPSMKGSLNYYDDVTHVRLYHFKDLLALLKEKGCTGIAAGLRKSWFYALITPLRIPLRWIRGKAVTGNVFWDLLGFAEYVWVKKS